MSVSASSPSSPSLIGGRRPREWWRSLCEVVLPDRRGARIVLSGDLPHDRQRAAEQLVEWQRFGVTHIVDVRGEVAERNDDCADRRFVAEHAPEITYVFLGTHDNGTPQDPRWFDAAIDALTPALDDPEAVILVHCHMGVNRGPSLGLRLLLEQGVKPFEALEAIREARPIAAVLYADDAIRHWFGVTSRTEAGRSIGRMVAGWHRDNPVDTGWIISRIRIAEYDE